jgi:signal transduction histidine kinase
MTDRKLRLLKWLMVLIPPVMVSLGHLALEYRTGLLGPAPGSHAQDPVVELLVIVALTALALVLAFIFVEALFAVLRKLQAEALDREQDIVALSAVMQERERLSRELHDGAAQLVADVLMRLDTIQELVEADRRPAAQIELERLRAVADEIYEDIGESITGLRTNVTDRGLMGALQDYLRQFEERHGIRVKLGADGAADQVASPAAQQLFMLVQEALTNVRKHAGARGATVTVSSDGPHRLRVVIADDGHGFTLGRHANGTARGLGLTSMRERTQALGGTFRVDSQPGSGTRVMATIPLQRRKTEGGNAAVASPAS